jgi:hypothetical protein
MGNVIFETQAKEKEEIKVEDFDIESVFCCITNQVKLDKVEFDRKSIIQLVKETFKNAQ